MSSGDIGNRHPDRAARSEDTYTRGGHRRHHRRPSLSAPYSHHNPTVTCGTDGWTVGRYKCL
jgi:hypothetical protein